MRSQPKSCGHANRGDVHFALFEDLGLGEVGFRVGSGGKAHAAAVEPGLHFARLGFGNLAHGGHQRGLAEPFLVDAGGIQQLVFDDGVVHSHAAFVENAHDGLAAEEPAGQVASQRGGGFRKGGGVERADVAEVMAHTPVRPAIGAASGAGNRP